VFFTHYIDNFDPIKMGMTDTEKYFNSFRRNIIGIDAEIETPYGNKKLVYADWIALCRKKR
jgi:hypothetical protein